MGKGTRIIEIIHLRAALGEAGWATGAESRFSLEFA